MLLIREEPGGALLAREILEAHEAAALLVALRAEGFPRAVIESGHGLTGAG